MEYLIEGIIDFLVDIVIEVIKNKKLSKYLRYPLLFIVFAFFLLVFSLIGYFGVKLIIKNKDYSLYIGIFLIIIDVILVYSFVRKVLIEIKK